MPYKSKAQMRKFFAMEAKGELPKGTAREWAHHTPDTKALPEHVEKKAGLNIKGLGERVRARLGKILPEAMTKTPARTAATVGAGATAAGVGAKALMDLSQHGDSVQVQSGAPGADQALQGMLGKMDTPTVRQTPQAGVSASGLTKAPGTLGGPRWGTTGAKMGVATAIGAAAGFGAGALSGRKAKKNQPGKMGKTAFGPPKLAADLPMMAAGAAAFPLVGGLAGAIHGVATAPRGKRLKRLGQGALRGAGGGLGALAGLTAGTLGGLSAGAALEPNHPLAAELAQKSLSLGGAMGGARLGYKAVDHMLNNDDEDDGYSYKYGSDAGSLLSRFSSRHARD